MATSIRVLVVDDNEPWRREVCSILQTQPELRVVAEVADGLEAVQKAKELQPDLILLDIGLPNLNGLEAANRIRQVASGAKIIFLTNNMDKDIVQAALGTGAQGYVLKTDAGRELLATLAGVLGGDDFVVVESKRISSPLSYAAKRSCNCSCVTPASRLSKTATSRNSPKRRGRPYSLPSSLSTHRDA